MVKHLARPAYLLAAWLFAILIPIQFFLAGVGAFSPTFSPSLYAPHMYLGLGLHGIAVALIAIALFGFLGRRALFFGVLQFALISLQILLVQVWSPGTAIAIEPAFVTSLFVTTMLPIHNAIASNAGLLAALHGVNGLAIAGVAVLNVLYARRLLRPTAAASIESR
jgi:hypothetical protein